MKINNLRCSDFVELTLNRGITKVAEAAKTIAHKAIEKGGEFIRKGINKVKSLFNTFI